MRKAFAVCFLCLLLIASSVSSAFAAPFDDDGLLRLVNREEKITKKYEPADLVKPNVPTNKKSQQESIYMRAEAAAALEKMFQAAMDEQGYTLLAVSGYRAYGLQQVMFNNKVAAVGSKEKAWRKVAPAGASEHQLGLAQDVICDNYRYLNSGFAETAEGQWLYANCHRFGFIVRYLKEWDDITGYAAEPWHFRYLGVNHAAAVHWLNIPYETYAHQAMLLPEYILTDGNAYLLYGVMDNALNGDGCLFEEICDAACETKEQQQATIEEMTAYFLPEGITLEMALSGQVH
ncbi:MAG: M15 family metallopeptidase [Clostridia bacterium]|nr:D-alanyl-D-alanine carboxypeptidase family protein [Clostridiales bacterium]MBQ6804814.1 M15 family metallopeptidase [Clostridia bacterium]